ncbi:MAG: hypothetical protein O7D29_10415 [Gemmatimonadetes bacterium]|nr:hypothetical protein [Gemmatimonadota bacterium]
MGSLEPIPGGNGYRILFSCAVKRCAFSAGVIPARQLSFQPVAVGAAMEVTISSKPLMKKDRLAVQRVGRP